MKQLQGLLITGDTWGGQKHKIGTLIPEQDNAQAVETEVFPFVAAFHCYG